MIRYIKYALLALLFSVLGYTGYNLYVYFFDINKPEISVVGMQDWCSGDVNAKLCGSDSYKILHASAWIDGKPLFEKEKVGSAQLEREFTIPTMGLDDGDHLLRCEIVDGTRSGNCSSLEIPFSVDNIDLQAALLKIQKQKILQGRCLKIKFRTNKPLKKACMKTMSNEFVCFPEYKNSTVYEAFVPVACEQEPGEFPFVIEGQDYVGNSVALQGDFSVLKAPFKQKVIHVKAGRLKDESQYTDLTDRDLEEKMLEIAQNSPAEKMWKGLFEVPLHMTGISTEFGLIRTSQERGRYAHKALDLISMPRSVVWASNDGVVVIKERYVHTGNTIVIDHGHGIVTLYCHLEEYAQVEVGQTIKKGKPIGTMGMTGYANGYHLHWELRVNNTLVEPMEWTKN
jgi:murein DD-endopeptidase MepM/ murein hydrolase activator NlpD